MSQLVSLSCFFDTVSTRPSNNESTPLKVEIPVKSQDETEDMRSVFYQHDYNSNIPDDTDDIIDKINSLNTGLPKPNGPKKHRYKIHTAGGSIVVDIDQLHKLQNEYEFNQTKKAELDALQNENESIKRYLNSRAMHLSPSNNIDTPIPPIPYIMNIPVAVMPQPFDFYNRFNLNNDAKTHAMNEIYQTRQSPFPNFPSLPSLSSFPFQNLPLQWPFAQLFPFIIKDPFLTFSQGGNWNNLFEYGQNADVCSRKQKSLDETSEDSEEDNKDLSDVNSLNPVQEVFARQARALKKRTITNHAIQQTNEDKKGKKIYVTKPVTTTQKKTTKKPYVVEELEEVKNEESGDLRFPFGDFGWFGNKKPVAPSPGFFINKLRVRKGGVAIAGPGGVATAGRGGTAIVGPGGLAYTQPGGLAVAGPAARVVALSPDADLHSLITRLQQDNDGSVPRSKQPIREGKVVATGPVVYYHPTEQT